MPPVTGTCFIPSTSRPASPPHREKIAPQAEAAGVVYDDESRTKTPALERIRAALNSSAIRRLGREDPRKSLRVEAGIRYDVVCFCPLFRTSI